MAQSNDELSAKLVSSGAAQTPLSIHHELKSWFDKALPAISDLCGQEEAKKLFATARVAIARNPALLSCTKLSLQNCILQSMALKLYPGPMQECAYVPFKGEATFMPQYQGLVKLAINGGTIVAANANIVHANDEFDFEEGTHSYLKHKRCLAGDRGPIIAVYATATLRNGDRTFVVMGVDEVKAIEARSPSVKRKQFSPWESDWGEMAKKTVIKRLMKLIPKNTELAEAIELDNELERPDLAKPAPLVDLDELEAPTELETKQPE